jgi:hypothetical protein
VTALGGVPVSKSTVTIRGFMSTRASESNPALAASYFDLNAVQVIEVPETSAMSVSDQGTVQIGHDPVKVSGEGEPEKWSYGRVVTYPAWRVMEIETVNS